MILTDPPYTTPTVTSFGRKKARNFADLSIQETYIRLLKREFERVMKPNAPLFIFCDDLYYPVLLKVFFDWTRTNLLVWDKGRIGMGNPFRKRHELIFYANRGSMETNADEGLSHYPTVLNYRPVPSDNRLHGAQKPVDLVTDLILGFSKKGDVVLDCFIGSGTTMVAAATTGRNFIGFDLVQECIEITNRRLNS
jgi:site-specific DNA-methyltransferase (adenine-specific)